MEAKKFEKLLKKFKNSKNSINVLFQETKIKESDYHRIRDILKILEYESYFLDGQFKNWNADDVIDYVQGTFTKLIQKECLKVFTKAQLLSFTNPGDIYLVHTKIQSTDSKKFWKSMSIVLKKFMQPEKEIRPENRNCLRFLAFELVHPIAGLMQVIADIEKKVFGTKMLEKEFVNGFKKILGHK